jgi:hypothetical protein
MPQYRFTTIRDLNTFSTILQKNWVVEVKCIAQNNPLLLLEDRMKIAVAVEEKYDTVCNPLSVNFTILNREIGMKN